MLAEELDLVRALARAKVRALNVLIDIAESSRESAPSRARLAAAAILRAGPQNAEPSIGPNDDDDDDDDDDNGDERGGDDDAPAAEHSDAGVDSDHPDNAPPAPAPVNTPAAEQPPPPPPVFSPVKFPIHPELDPAFDDPDPATRGPSPDAPNRTAPRAPP